MELGKKVIYIVLLGILLSSCHDELGPQGINGGALRPDTTAAIIVNEGNFQWGNASIGQFDPERSEYQDGLFRRANNAPLGDVIQEAHRIEERYYLVINGSNKLLFCNADWEQIQEVEGKSAPRNLVFWQQGIVLSDLFQPVLMSWDLAGNPGPEYQTDGTAFGLEVWKDLLIIAHRRQLQFLANPNESPAQLKTFSRDLENLERFNDQLVLTFSNGEIGLWEDPDSNIMVIDTLQILSGGIIGLSKENRFFTYDGSFIYEHRSEQGFKGIPRLAISCENFYGLDYHQGSNSLYLFDALTFVQPHRVRRIELNAFQVVDDFEAGALPNGLLKEW